MKRHYKLPTVLGLVVLLAGILVGSVLVTTRQTGTVRGNPYSIPENLQMTNVSDSAISISWTTATSTESFLSYGTTASLGEIAETGTGRINYLTLDNLKPNTTYYFKINSAGYWFDNNGAAYEIKTAPSLPKTRKTEIIFGSIADQGRGADAIVYMNMAGVSPLSAKTDNDGNWLINLGVARSENLSSYATYDKETAIDIQVQGRARVAEAKTLVSVGKPVPEISLGGSYDFTKGTVAESDSPPTATIEFPKEAKE